MIGQCEQIGSETQELVKKLRGILCFLKDYLVAKERGVCTRYVPVVYHMNMNEAKQSIYFITSTYVSI